MSAADFQALGVDISKIPALAPPPGVIPNFVNPVSRAYQPRIAVGICFPIMAVFVLLRVYCKLFVTQNWGFDDWTTMLAVAVACAFQGLGLSVIGHPLGPHQWNVPLSAFDDNFQKRSLSGSLVYYCTATLFKSAILLLYFRIFKPSKAARLLIYGGIGTIVAFYLITFITNLSLCVPRASDVGGWTSATSQARCALPNQRLALGSGIFSFISDVYVLSIPIFLVSALQLPLRRKIGVVAIFLTGTIACACSLTSLIYRVRFNGQKDFAWTAVPVYTWSFAEVNIGIATGCMPTVAPLFRSERRKGFRIPGLSYFRSRFSSNRSRQPLVHDPSYRPPYPEHPGMGALQNGDSHTELGSARSVAQHWP